MDMDKKKKPSKKAEKNPVGRPPVDETKEDREKREAIEQKTKDREQLIKNLQNIGFPIHDEDILENLLGFAEAQKKVKNKFGGRPTKYDPEMCEMVEWLGSRGYSLKHIAFMIGVNADTIYAWAKNFPEFSESLSRARDGAQAWWEMIGQSALFSKNFNSFVWNKIISNRFRQDYTDRKGLPYNPAEPEAVEAADEVLQLDPRDLTDEQVELFRLAIEAAKEQESE